MKKRWVLLVAVVSCIILSSIKVSGISTHEESQVDVNGYSTLYALKRVVCCCVVLPRTIEDGIHRALYGNGDELDAACVAMQNDLRSKMHASLCKVGLEVLENSYLADEQTAYLGVEVIVRKIAKDQSFYAFSVHVKLKQLVQLARNPQILTVAETWPNTYHSPNIIFVSGFQALQETIKKEVSAKVDIFTNDYLAANPKERSIEDKVKN